MANFTDTGLSLSSTGSGLNQLSHGQRILVAAARMAFEPAAPDPDLISSERIPQGHKQWDVQTVARLADASALTEGLAMTESQQLYVNTTQITPSEHGIIVTVSKELIRRQGNFNVLNVAGEMMGRSLRRRMAKDVIALYDGLSKSGPGAGSSLDITYVKSFVAYLLTDNDSEFGPAELPVHMAAHIEQIADIILDITDPGTAAGARPAGFGDELLQRWWRGSDRLYGVPIFHSGNIQRDSSDDAKGAIFNPRFAALVIANEAEQAEDEDIFLRAWESGIFQTWGEAEVADPYGVEVYSDAASNV